MDHRRDAAYPASVRSGDTAGGVGVVAQHGDHFAQGKDEHADKKNGCGGIDGEEGDTGNKQQKAKDSLGDLGEFSQQDSKNGRKQNDHKAVKGVEISVYGSAGLSHRVFQLQGEQDAHQIGGHGGKASEQQHIDQHRPLPEDRHHRDLLIHRKLILAVILFHGSGILRNRIFGMHEEDDQYRGNENHQTVDAESQTQEVFKQNTRDTGADNEAQIETQIGKRIGLHPLFGGGIVGVQRVVCRGFDRLKQARKKQDRRGNDGKGQNRSQQIQADRQKIKYNDDGFSVKPVSQLAAQ